MEVFPDVVTIDLDAPETAHTAERLLDALGGAGTSSTFFVSGPFIDRHARLVSRMAALGHEVGCLTREQPAKSKPYCAKYCGELEAIRDAIEAATGVRVRGHRNAAFAVNYESEWVYDVLLDRGFEYDSSRTPSARSAFGYPEIPRSAHAVRRWGGTLLELPVSTADILAMRVRLGAAGTIRGLPLAAWTAIATDRHTRGEPLVVRLRGTELKPKVVARAGRIASELRLTSVARALPQLRARAPLIDC